MYGGLSIAGNYKLLYIYCTLVVVIIIDYNAEPACTVWKH